MRIATTTMGTTTAIAVFPPVDRPDDFCTVAPPDTNDPAEEDVDDATVLLVDVGAWVGGGAGGSVEVTTITTGVPPALVGDIVVIDVRIGADTTEVVPGLVEVVVIADEIIEKEEEEVSEGVTVEAGIVVVETKVVGGIEVVVIGTNVDEGETPGTAVC